MRATQFGQRLQETDRLEHARPLLIASNLQKIVRSLCDRLRRKFVRFMEIQEAPRKKGKPMRPALIWAPTKTGGDTPGGIATHWETKRREGEPRVVDQGVVKCRGNFIVRGVLRPPWSPHHTMIAFFHRKTIEEKTGKGTRHYKPASQGDHS